VSSPANTCLFREAYHRLGLHRAAFLPAFVISLLLFAPGLCSAFPQEDPCAP